MPSDMHTSLCWCVIPLLLLWDADIELGDFRCYQTQHCSCLLVGITLTDRDVTRVHTVPFVLTWLLLLVRSYDTIPEWSWWKAKTVWYQWFCVSDCMIYIYRLHYWFSWNGSLGYHTNPTKPLLILAMLWLE